MDMDLTDLDQAWKEADALFEEFQEQLLEPRTVSGWLGLPGSQLPRETAKIIGQPAQPARKKGSSARYSVKDAILMKLGRTLTEMGITPHRVRACVETVRENYQVALWGYDANEADDHSDDEIATSFYIIGRETSVGFKVVLIAAEQLHLFITESGLMKVEWRRAVRAAQQKRLEAILEKEPAMVDLSDFRVGVGSRGDYRPPGPILPNHPWKPGEHADELTKLAEEGYSLIDRVDPGSPAIVQNVTRYLQDQCIQLYRQIEEVESKTKG